MAHKYCLFKIKSVKMRPDPEHCSKGHRNLKVEINGQVIETKICCVKKPENLLNQ